MYIIKPLPLAGLVALTLLMTVAAQPQQSPGRIRPRPAEG
jgi:hypothetical protein